MTKGKRLRGRDTIIERKGKGRKIKIRVNISVQVCLSLAVSHRLRD